MAVTLLQLRTQARQRADMVNSQFITDAEFNTMINSSYAELYDLLVQKYGDDYFVASPQAIATDGSTDRWSLNSDFYKLLGVDLQINGGANGWLTLHQFNFADRNRIADIPTFIARASTAIRYRLSGNQIWFNPVPSGGQNIRIWYVPRPTPMVADTDTMDGVSGWEEYVVLDVAMKALLKEESDVSGLMAQKAAIIHRIEAAAENRDAGGSQTVSDTRRDDIEPGWWRQGGGW